MGIQSSIIQRVTEGLDELHDEIMQTGKPRLVNKVAGILVTGDSDGAEHVTGNLTNFFVALGLTIPTFGTLTVLWLIFTLDNRDSSHNGSFRLIYEIKRGEKGGCLIFY